MTSSIPTQTIDVQFDSLPSESLKNAYRMETLRPRMQARVQITFTASPVARIIRRDWNFVSSKLYMHALNPEYRKLIEDDVIELCWQINDANDDIQRMPFQRTDTQWMRPRTFDLQVIHPIAAKWLKAMITLDRMYATLVSAEKLGLITKRKRKGFILPSLVSYFTFKGTATKMILTKEDEEDLS